MLAIQTSENQIISENGVNFRSFFDRWTVYLDASDRTVASYTSNVRRFLDYMRENGISQPDRNHIIAYRDSLAESHKASTVNLYLISVKLFFKWLAAEGLYPNIADHVKAVKVTKGFKKDYLTSKQAGRMLGNIDRTTIAGKRDYAILCLMVTTGLRTISIIKADAGDIRTLGDDLVLYFIGKGRSEKDQFVKLSGHVQEAIADYFQARGQVKDNEPLFASVANRNNGSRMTTRSISRIAKDSMIDSGLVSSRLTAHSLRHTAATLNLLNGGTLQETQQLLGHSNIATTLIYSQNLERAKNNSEARIDEAIFGEAAA